MIFKLITINYSYSTLQIQKFKLHFLFLRRPQYSRVLKLKAAVPEEEGEVAEVKGSPSLVRCPRTSARRPGCI